jgi:hypothetical protein
VEIHQEVIILKAEEAFGERDIRYNRGDENM